MDNITFNNWWPGCGYEEVTQSCTHPCYNASILEDMDAFNKNANGSIVTYQSRPGTSYDGSPIGVVDLAGWWLPAPGDSPASPAPRIVLQHGFTSNSNKLFPQFAAYMLRSLGFSVLVPNFRDHCYSGNTSEHVYQWSNAYPYDLLGAWDYARMGPEGLLGGPRDTGQVGLMGFSKGSFVSCIAFGLEGSVPAAWLDSGPWKPKSVFEHGARQTLDGWGIGFASDILIGPTWDAVKKAALEKGVDLDWQLPEHTLPTGPDTMRPVYILQNMDDETVPVAENDLLRDMLAKYPEKYTVAGDWVFTGKCYGGAHLFEMFRSYTEYRDQLCSFWSAAFGLGESHCKKYA
ncbi:unnamed protein product [Prorocentrum cordatum]|uniref:Chlorophyllase n=1 Tax=Prorocentrum cordatum TaxID=2364126 RepID=A0ABN9VTB0_9DINO|nr:unnamed protein product [Polarella glacialis]